MEIIFEKSKRLSTIIDLWSSKLMDGYMGVSISGVNENFMPFNFVLACREIIGSHTSANAFRAFTKTLFSLGNYQKRY